MKRYLVFFGDCYYPSGGGYDFVADFDNLEAARNIALQKCLEWGTWAHVFDTVERKVIYNTSYNE